MTSIRYPGLSYKEASFANFLFCPRLYFDDLTCLGVFQYLWHLHSTPFHSDICIRSQNLTQLGRSPLFTHFRQFSLSASLHTLTQSLSVFINEIFV